jgi:hypothetical protein
MDELRIIRGLSPLLPILIPIIIIKFGMNKWEPKNRVSFAQKFSLWPVVICSINFGSPILHLFNLPVASTSNFGQVIYEWLCIGLCTIPIFYGIGYMIAIKRFPSPTN